MGVIDRILRLQGKYLEIAQEARTLKAEYDALVRRYGTRDQRDARLNELKDQLSKGVTVEPGEHTDEFDSRHNLQIEGKTRRWTNVRGCPSCDRINEKYGRSAIRRKIDETRRQNTEAWELSRRIDELWKSHRSVAEELGALEEGLLPSYYLRLDGTGRITATGSIRDFEVQGRRILDEGTYVDYDVNGRTARAVLDSSEQLVAYHLGDGNWTVMWSGAKPRIMTKRGWYSVLRKEGTVELMIDRNGEFTNSYPHVHVIHDERNNKIRVVASRSASDHSPPEILSGDASGNEVNAAVERAIRLL